MTVTQKEAFEIIQLGGAVRHINQNRDTWLEVGQDMAEILFVSYDGYTEVWSPSLEEMLLQEYIVVRDAGH
jgi:hypothetical protein